MPIKKVTATNSPRNKQQQQTKEQLDEFLEAARKDVIFGEQPKKGK